MYWFEASASAIRVIENVMSTNDIIEPAIVDSIARAFNSRIEQARPASHRFAVNIGIQFNQAQRERSAARDNQCGREPQA